MFFKAFGIKGKGAWVAGAIALATVGAGVYSYVFIAGAPQLDPPKAEQRTGLNFQVETYMSQAMGEERSYGVVLPPGYVQNPQKHYPVIVLLHGGHGTSRDYEDKAKLTSVLHDLYKSNRLPPSIVITPDGNDSRGSSPFWDPNYFDGPTGKVATLIGTDLVETVRSRYRTLNQPQFWAIGGLSSGAWGAFNIGLRHPERFHILFSHTGYFIDKSGIQNSPEKFVEQLPENDRKKLRIYLDAGEADEKYLDATQDFHNTLKKLGISSELHVYPGGHGIVGQDVGWNYWHKHLADSLSFVGRQFRAAEKHPHPIHSAPKQEKRNETPKPEQGTSLR
jgi:enterochelin esterase-like enzyme